MRKLLKETKEAEKEDIQKQVMKEENYKFAALPEDVHKALAQLDDLDEPYKILMPNPDGSHSHEHYDLVVSELGPKMNTLLEDLLAMKHSKAHSNSISTLNPSKMVS